MHKENVHRNERAQQGCGQLLGLAARDGCGLHADPCCGCGCAQHQCGTIAVNDVYSRGHNCSLDNAFVFFFCFFLWPSQLSRHTTVRAMCATTHTTTARRAVLREEGRLARDGRRVNSNLYDRTPSGCVKHFRPTVSKAFLGGRPKRQAMARARHAARNGAVQPSYTPCGPACSAF